MGEFVLDVDVVLWKTFFFDKSRKKNSKIIYGERKVDRTTKLTLMELAP